MQFWAMPLNRTRLSYPSKLVDIPREVLGLNLLFHRPTDTAADSAINQQKSREIRERVRGEESRITGDGAVGRLGMGGGWRAAGG